MSKLGSICGAIFVRHLAFSQRTAFRGAIVILCCVAALPAFGQTSVLTQHNDNARTGQNTSEKILNTLNVNVNQFGKLFAMPADGQVYGQPLYVPGVTINGAVHNVVVIVTENDSVYAYDADSSGAPLWKASMVDAAHGAGSGETALNNANTINCVDLQTHIGITSTPVIDPTSETIYVEAKSTNGTNYFHRLHALDLRTGSEKSPGPVVIDATVSGTGDGSSNGQLTFDNLHQLNRPGLLRLNGTIYIAYASQCDFSPYHGWLFAYDEATFALKSVYVTTPNGGLGGFWMSGAGVAADASGNIFIASGNGDFDTTHVPAKETSDTIVKLGTTNQILTQLDYFTPQDQSNLQVNDLDLGSGGVLILPDQPGSFPHILVHAGKEGRVYVVNRDQMTTNNTHYCSGCANDPEIIEESGFRAVEWMFNIPAYWNNTLYFWGAQDVLKSIPITNGLPDFAHVTGSTPQLGFPGAGLSVSSNGATPESAIVWAIDGTQYGAPGPGPGPAVLYAYDATNVSTMLYSSAQNATRDAAGNAVKFVVPTIANGKVYVGTSAAVDAYGLLSVAPSIISLNPTSGKVGSWVTITGANFGTSGTVKFNGTTATTTSWSATSIVTSVPTGATSGVVVVTVGGVASNGVNFTVTSSVPPPSITSLNPTSGPVGTAITITGTNFGPSGTVKFNGTTATTTSWSATSIVTSVPSGATTGNVVVTAGGAASNGVAFTVTTSGSPTINYGSGFTASGMNLLGSAKLNGTALRLTDGGSTEAGAGWYGTQVNIQSFTTDFTFLISGGTSPAADGLTFTIQRKSGSVLGNLGGALGYGPSTSGASGIPTSVAVKFDLYSNSGEGVDSTGLYTNGAWPTMPALDMSGSGVNLHSGDPFHVHMTYDGTNLVMTITDTTTNKSFSHTWAINIPTTVGGNVAYVGFTGGSGGLTAIQAIQTWTFTSAATAPTTINYGSGFTAGGMNLLGSAKLNGTALRLTDGGSTEAGAGWYGTEVNIQNFTTDFTFLISGGTNPTADGLTFTIQRKSGSALGNLGGALGYGPSTSGAAGIPTSVAVKFDLYSNSGEGVDSTGLYTNGAWPTVPALDMSGSGVNLHSGDPFHVHMTYDGTNLVMTITDTTTNKSFSHTWAINIPTTVGGNVAYVGFTGGSGGLTAIQAIQTWTFTP